MTERFAIHWNQLATGSGRFNVFLAKITARFNWGLEKMYRQVLDHPDEWKCHSIIWRYSLNHPIEIFHLRTLTYGEGPSCYIATRVLHQLAYDHQSEYHLGAEILRKEIYRDDVSSGKHTIAETHRLAVHGTKRDMTRKRPQIYDDF